MSSMIPTPIVRVASIRLLALALLLVLTCAVGAADAGAAKPKLLSVTPAVGPPGTSFAIKYRGGSVRCSVSVKQSWRGGRRQLSRPIRPGQQVTFRSKSNDTAGRRRVSLRCGGKQRRVFFEIHAAASKDLAPTVDDTDPFDDLGITDAELAGAPPLEAVGGNGFTTRAPFPNGMSVLVTQSRRGGTSHSKASTLNAVDFAVPSGTPVLAGVPGYVVRAQGGCPNSRSDKCNGGWGNNVVIRAGDGSCVLHAHLSAIEVTPGMSIDRSRELGRSGTSGYSTGPHLHYDRVSCSGATQSWEWGLDETGGEVPRTGARVVSQNEPGASAPAPAPAQPSAPAVRTITVDNRVTNGMGMREDTTPARLNTKPWIRCSSRGCAIGGTERGSGQTYESAVCQTTGERTTNGHDTSAADDANPERFESNRYYGVRLSNGTFGYVSEVWIRASERGGLGLPGC